MKAEIVIDGLYKGKVFDFEEVPEKDMVFLM